MPTNETYELIFSGKLAGNFVQNILHANITVASVDPWATAVDLLDTWIGPGDACDLWCDMLPSDYELTSMRCRRILATGGPTAIYLQSALPTSVGARTGVVSVTSNAPLIIWLPGTDPARTGRTFIPGVSEADIDGNLLVAGVVTAMGAFGSYWSTGGSTSGGDTWGGAVYRRPEPDHVPPITAQSRDIQNYRISSTIGTQRRRQKPN